MNIFLCWPTWFNLTSYSSSKHDLSGGEPTRANIFKVKLTSTNMLSGHNIVSYAHNNKCSKFIQISITQFPFGKVNLRAISKLLIKSVFTQIFLNYVIQIWLN